MLVKKNHNFHMVDYSPWPLINALAVLSMMSGLVEWFNNFNSSLMLLGMMTVILISVQWWRDVAREGTLQGLHTSIVIKSLKIGMMLFITSEVFFFLSFFWAFFHSSLSPTLEIGLFWPPSGISMFNPFQVPLLNTIILLSSGVTITWSHHSIMESNHTQAYQSLLLTIILGIYFTSLQLFEYLESSFSISDSIFGSTFFVATGFHGLHVLIGTMFLYACLMRMLKMHFSEIHHFGFEAAAWYWHFVDVVWLFLFINLYWWSN